MLLQLLSIFSFYVGQLDLVNYADILRTKANVIVLKLAANTDVVLVGVVGGLGLVVGRAGTGVVEATIDGSHRFPWQQATSQEVTNPVMFIMLHTAKRIKRYVWVTCGS